MYISKVIIKGFRNYKDAIIPLHDGVNIIIGANNTGKSNLLKAIALTLNEERRIDVDDLFCEIDVEKLKQHSPIASISLIINQSADESDSSDLVGLLGECMTSLPTPYEAQLNFQFSLSDDQEEAYKKDVENLTEHKDIWNLIHRDYARFYEVCRWGGSKRALKESLNSIFDRCDLHFLDALRDVGRNMFMGYNPMLRDVLNFFVDYSVKTSTEKDEKEIKEELIELQKNFKEKSEPIIDLLLSRLKDGKDVLLDYADDIGASFGNVKPDFSGMLSESELFAVLRLIIRYETGVEIPATHNGLGYNNLIYMSLLLAKMQVSADGDYMKRQAKLYSLLAIEEPEAHLHPAMQYQFLNFLSVNRSKHNVNQILVTTHSTQIVSAVDIDNLICLSSESYGNVSTAYPRLVYEKEKKSKAYVQRYLDATRSDLFFANKLIFVEGIAEELLIPTFAKYLGYDLAKQHVLIVNMGGRYYNHFLKMFEDDSYGIKKKVACITDIDPCCDDNACYPYEYGKDKKKKYTHHADEEIRKYSSHPYIRYFRQNETYGKTLEYDIVLSNYQEPLIVVDGMKNIKELKNLMKSTSLEEMKELLRDSEANDIIIKALDECGWNEEEKKKALIASRYLNSVSKGGDALALSTVLEANRIKNDSDPTKVNFIVPQYIKDALTWLLG